MPESVIVRPCEDSDFDSVVNLGDRYKKYLGLYPHKAIRESIATQHVFGAFIDDRLIGYVLFAPSYFDIRLVHLCIEPEYRNQGIARKLVDEIQERHSDRLCIRLKCRRDYPAHKIWPKLGFQAESFPTGRGKDKAEMTAWRRSFGHPDLFTSRLEDDVRVQVSLDTNIILDLVLNRNIDTKGFIESPLLVGESIFCISRTVKNELSELPTEKDRRRVMGHISQFEELHCELSATETVYHELLRDVGQLEIEKDPSLRSDVMVLAETIVGGASVLISNDDNAAKTLRPFAELRGVDILHPSQLVVRIDELKDPGRRTAERIQNTALKIIEASAGSDRELDHLTSFYAGEKKAEFRQLIRAKSGNSEIKLVHAEASSLADALIVTNILEGDLNAELLRVRAGQFAPILLKQLIFQLRQEALRRGTPRLVVTDPAPGGGFNATSTLEEEGAKRIGNYWIIEVVDAQLEISDIASGRVGPWNLSPWIDNYKQSAMEFSELERHLWPMKILGSGLPCYVVPIKQAYASELLGYDEPLLDRNQALGISRRHVYYKSATFRPEAPGRILWYVSGKQGGSIVATSHLVSTHVATPKALHSRFKKYGVWSLMDIEGHAKKLQKAVALRFGDTEILRRQIKLSDAEAIVKAFGHQLGSMPTTRKISESAFHEIYSKGMEYR